VLYGDFGMNPYSVDSNEALNALLLHRYGFQLSVYCFITITFLKGIIIERFIAVTVLQRFIA
jgi:hypothetical protein